MPVLEEHFEYLDEPRRRSDQEDGGPSGAAIAFLAVAISAALVTIPLTLMIRTFFANACGG